MAIAAVTTEVAKMGYVGLATVYGVPVRITSSNIGFRQPIEPSDMIDGAADRVIYRQTGASIEGDISFPLIADDSFSILNILWDFAVNRDQFEGEVTDGDVVIKYSQTNERGEGGTYRFKGCKIQSFRITVVQGDAARAELSLWAKDRTAQNAGPNQPGSLAINDLISGFQSILTQFTEGGGGINFGNVAAQALGITPICTLTWANTEVFGYSFSEGLDITDPSVFDRLSTGKRPSVSGSNTFNSNLVRSFTLDITNNLDRTYTFERLKPKIDRITTGQRDVTGSLEFQGWSPTENISPLNTVDNYSDETIELRFRPATTGMVYESAFGTQNEFIRRFFGVVYELQDISSTMGVITSTVNWRAHGVPTEAKDYEAYIALDAKQPNLTIFDTLP